MRGLNILARYVLVTLTLIILIELNIGCDDKPTEPKPEIASVFEPEPHACDSSFYALTPEPKHLQVVGFFQSWGCQFWLTFRSWRLEADTIAIDLDLGMIDHDCFNSQCPGDRYVIDMNNIPSGEYLFQLRYYKTSPFFPPVWITAWEDTVHVQ
jgi:hypothetical protein